MQLQKNKLRHINYQNILKIKKKIDQDKIRIDWLTKNIKKLKIKKATDIGANLGYMCLELSKKKN